MRRFARHLVVACGTWKEFEAEFDQLRAEFCRLPEQQQQAYQAAPVAQVDLAGAASRYNDTVGSNLWHMSSVDWPMTPEIAQQILDDALPHQAGASRQGPLPEGLTKRLQPIREDFLSKSLQLDEGSATRLQLSFQGW